MNHIATGISIKALIAANGLAGGLTVYGFYIPKRIAEKGLMLAGAIVTASSIFCSLAFTEVILTKFGLDPETYVMPVAFIIGGSSLFVLNAITNWARQHEEDTVFDVIKQIQDTEKKNQNGK